MSKGLMQDSLAYRALADKYELFSACEDVPGLVDERICSNIEGWTLLDLGSGSGKFLWILSQQCDKIIALDQSAQQIEVAKQKFENNNISRIEHDATQKLPFEDASIDIIFCAWMIGTIPLGTDREQCIQDCKRVLRSGWKIILVDNYPSGEFEEIRWKTLLHPNPTQVLMESIKSWWFEQVALLHSYFEFPTLLIAKDIFTTFWWVLVGNKVQDAKILHDIAIYTYTHFK